MKTLHHLLLTSLALGLLTGRAGAEIFPVFEDAAGSVKANTITKAGGTAKTLAISKTSNAYLNFLVSSAEIDPRFISAARLVIFLPKTTPKGVISIRQLTSGWTEKLTTPKITAPALGNVIDQIDLEDIPLKADYYIADVTDLVKSWMTNPAQEFGIAIVSDGVANVTLASKEGFTSGHPAFIEIDTSTVINTNDDMVATSYAARFQTWLVGQNQAPDTPDVFDNFFIYNQTTNATRLSISPNGSVGIGTSSPVADLDVRNGGTIRATGTGQTAGLELTPFDPDGNAPAGRIQSTDDGGFGGHLDFMTKPIGSISNPLGLRMRIRSTGDVGIGTGTTNPGARLHIQQPNAGSTLLLQGGDAEGENPPARAGLAFSYFDSPVAKHFITTNHSISTPANNKMGFWLNNRVGSSTDDAPGNGTTQVMTLTGQGRVGIGAVNPSFTLDVNGDLRCFGFTNSSDARYKRDLRPLTGALGKVRALRARSYDWDHAAFPDKDLPKRRSIGFIAQEMREVLPELVTEDAEGYLSIAYTEVIPVLTQAIQELHTQVSTKDSEITRLKARLAQLEAREEDRDTQLAAIHAMLRSGGKAQALPASLQGSDTGAE